MKNFLRPLLFLTPLLALADVAKISPTDAAKLVSAGQAVLVDVREPSEWNETGVAAPAVLLAKSDFEGDMAEDWKLFLARNADKEIILYCRSGKRAGIVAEALKKSGHQVANAGGFKEWEAAGLPVRQVGVDKK